MHHKNVYILAKCSYQNNAYKKNKAAYKMFPLSAVAHLALTQSFSLDILQNQ